MDDVVGGDLHRCGSRPLDQNRSAHSRHHRNGDDSDVGELGDRADRRAGGGMADVDGADEARIEPLDTIRRAADPRPRTRGNAPAQYAQTCCGIQAGSAEFDDDWPDD